MIAVSLRNSVKALPRTSVLASASLLLPGWRTVFRAPGDLNALARCLGLSRSQSILRSLSRPGRQTAGMGQGSRRHAATGPHLLRTTPEPAPLASKTPHSLQPASLGSGRAGGMGAAGPGPASGRGKRVARQAETPAAAEAAVTPPPAQRRGTAGKAPASSGGPRPTRCTAAQKATAMLSVSAAVAEAEDLGGGAGGAATAATPPVSPVNRKRGRGAAGSPEADGAAAGGMQPPPSAKRVRARRTAGTAVLDVRGGPAASRLGGTTVAAKGRARRKARAGGAGVDAGGVGISQEDVAVPTAEVAVVKRKARGNNREPDPLPFTEPTPELLSSMAGYQPPPLPVPNLGYACLNMTLRSLKPPIFTSRDCIKRTLDEKGLPYLGELCLANCRDLARLIQWNAEQGIRFFRMSSVLFPWMGTFQAKDLPNYGEVAAALRFAGDLARAYNQRITFHPSHFVKLAAPAPQLLQKSINELEAHSEILDLMGYAPSPWNKINIHVGGQYGSKDETIVRFAENFKRLSPACRARLTVENDDVATSFSLQDLLELHRLTGIPLTFDFHHHRFCPGGLTEKEAFLAAVKTWPEGVRPVVHWSESQPGRKPHAHSDYVKGPIFLHGLERDVDVMIEAKCKEQALLCYRDGIPIPEQPAALEPPLSAEDAVALKLLD